MVGFPGNPVLRIRLIEVPLEIDVRHLAQFLRCHADRLIQVVFHIENEPGVEKASTSFDQNLVDQAFSNRNIEVLVLVCVSTS